MKRFALIGVGGYIAPRHMKAIKDTGNVLVAAVDKNDSVGVIDSYFPDADFFTEFERFDRHIEKLKQEKKCHIDYVSICSPNYLHDAHIRFALRVGADAICEKPLVLNPWNLDALELIESETERRIHNILQLRLHPAIVALKEKIDSVPRTGKHEVDLTYIAPRGRWYFFSWKGDVSKSGGIATNIGTHFFDMVMWIFGPMQESHVHVSGATRAAGYLELEKARVRWFLSIDRRDLEILANEKRRKTYRSIVVDGEEVEFSDGFGELHTESYRKLLKGDGFGIGQARAYVETVHSIRNAMPIGVKGEYHPLLKRVVTQAD